MSFYFENDDQIKNRLAAFNRIPWGEQPDVDEERLISPSPTATPAFTALSFAASATPEVASTEFTVHTASVASEVALRIPTASATPEVASCVLEVASSLPTASVVSASEDLPLPGRLTIYQMLEFLQADVNRGMNRAEYKRYGFIGRQLTPHEVEVMYRTLWIEANRMKASITVTAHVSTT
jgi:hypothetical protein